MGKGTKKRDNLFCSPYIFKHSRHVETNNKTKKMIDKAKAVNGRNIIYYFATFDK